MNNNRRTFFMTLAAGGSLLATRAHGQAKADEKDPQSVALGYVDKELADSDGPWSIEILGERFPARLQRVPLFDADGKRQRG